MITAIFICIFVAFIGIQILYYILFSTLLFHKNTTNKSSGINGVSVLVCAKNEAENLRENIPIILNQSYHSFEVVLINDGSTDETLSVMKEFQKENDNVKIVNVENNENFWGNKKYALTLGIKAAKYETLLFTDADCKPASKFWISETAKYFNQNKTIVLGYGKYKRNKTLVNLFVRFETLLTAIQYFSYAKIGIPYMGVGRNLAYQKKEFYKVKGFASHLHIKSGDDDLFIQDAANKENTTLCIHPKSFTISNAPSSLKKWFRQKRRHISTANYYQNKHKILLAYFFFTKIMIYIIGIFLAFSYSFEFVSVSFCLYFGVQITVLTLVANKFKERGITFYIPLLEIGLLLFQFSIFITNFISKPTHWK